MENQIKISISKTFTDSFQIYQKHFVYIALISIAVYLPINILIELISSWLASPNYENINDLSELQSENQFYHYIRVFFGAIASLAIINLTFSTLKNENTEKPWTYFLKYGLLNWPSYIVIAISAGLKVLLYTLFLIIPGIYQAVRFTFLDCAFVENEETPTDRSEYVVDNRWFTIFGFVIIVFLINLGVEILVYSPFIILPESPVLLFCVSVLIHTISSFTIVVKANYFFELQKALGEISEEDEEDEEDEEEIK
ncbi:MAG: hypothetical protein JJU02_04465 [Cryomorphaceae bacterium]|nr:hypothetical protein [Cryomorphaceae bacterium]